MFYLYHVICFKIEIQLEGFAKPDTPNRNFSEFEFNLGHQHYNKSYILKCLFGVFKKETEQSQPEVS